MSIRTRELDITPVPLSSAQVLVFRLALPVFIIASIAIAVAGNGSFLGIGWVLLSLFYFIALLLNPEFRAEILGQRPLLMRVAIGEESILIEHVLAGRLFRAGTQRLRFEKVWEVRFYDETLEFVGKTAFESKTYIPRAALIDEAEVERLAEMLKSKGIRVSRPDLSGVKGP